VRHDAGGCDAQEITLSALPVVATPGLAFRDGDNDLPPPLNGFSKNLIERLAV
jgi:hypothetical protein